MVESVFFFFFNYDVHKTNILNVFGPEQNFGTLVNTHKAFKIDYNRLIGW